MKHPEAPTNQGPCHKTYSQPLSAPTDESAVSLCTNKAMPWLLCKVSNHWVPGLQRYVKSCVLIFGTWRYREYCFGKGHFKPMCRKANVCSDDLVVICHIIINLEMGEDLEVGGRSLEPFKMCVPGTLRLHAVLGNARFLYDYTPPPLCNTIHDNNIDV